MKKLLIVEDNAFNMELTTQLLEDDYELVTATDGKAGLAAAMDHTPDLILMDLSLPEMDGWTAIKEIRKDPNIGKTPIVALSAHAATPDIERALAAGADEYVTKPLDDDLLLNTIERLLAKTDD